MRVGIDLGPEDLRPQTGLALPGVGQVEDPDVLTWLEGFLGRIEHYGQLADNILTKLANLQNNPQLAALLQQRAGQRGEGTLMHTERTPSDIDIDKLLKQLTARVQALQAVYGERTLNELAGHLEKEGPRIRKELAKIVAESRR